MHLKAKIFHSGSTDPWFNLALEDHLVETVSREAAEGVMTVILYLWQNENTVVIGRNQNAWTECRTELLEAEGGRLARRSTGGGAVFHDLGNLNFSIITPKSMYETKRSLGIIVEAVNRAGVKAYLSGRNDILAEDLKFSGNAFLVRKEAGLHHGTLLIDSDHARIARYLNVPKAKLEAKGIKSVRSRIVNLSALREEINVDLMKELAEQAFTDEYMPDDTERDVIWYQTNTDGFRELYHKYRSWEWRYGESLAFTAVMESFFPWGSLQMCFAVANGVIDDLRIYTDALDSEFFAEMADRAKGSRFKCSELTQILETCSETPDIVSVTGNSVKEDIRTFLHEQMK